MNSSDMAGMARQVPYRRGSAGQGDAGPASSKTKRARGSHPRAR